MIGIVYSGNFYTPTNVDFPNGKIFTTIKTLSPSLIITDTNNKSKLLDIGVKEEQIICYDLIDFKQQEINLKTNISKAIDTDIVYTYFTSGSTGVPKGVTINHKNIIDYIDWACEKFPIDNTTIFGNQSALYFDISTQDIYATLKKSATMVIIPERLFAFPIKAVEFIKERNINFLYWVPSAYVNLANFKSLDNITLSNIKSIMFGGEVMPVKHLNYIKERLPNLEFIANVYGPTEATVNSTYHIIDVNKELDEKTPLPLGKVIENKKILILDEKNKLVTKQNQTGELCILGTSLSPGYYKNTEKTNESFVQNPLHEDYHELIYKTGDLAFYDSNNLLVFSGRKDNQIKHLGYRIELGEIETAALSIKELDNCACLYNEDKRAITLLYKSKTLEVKEVKLLLGKILPKYMVPTKYYKIEEFPINANGKIDRLLLKQEYI